MKMAVHNGVFHADEVFGVALMETIYDQLEVVRTRDVSILESCDLVADVGGGKYDHHKTDKEMREDGIPYSAFGLLWRDFGKTFVQKICSELSTDEIEEISEKVATEFITQIDAGDNGITLNTYESPVTTLSQIISSFMPLQSEKKDVDAAFFEAVAFAKRYLQRLVRQYGEYYEHLHYMKAALNEQNIKESRILVLEKSVKWKDILIKLDTQENVLFVVFEDVTGSWRVQTVPKEENSFEARVDLPEAWASLRSEELSKLTGISGCVFCHPNLFICGNETKEGALAMARQAVKERTK